MDISRDVKCVKEDFGTSHLHCLNKPNVSEPRIAKCLAYCTRLAHHSLSSINFKANQENIWAHVKRLFEISRKVDKGEMLTEEERELSERDGDKSLEELEDELGLVETPPFEEFVKQVAAFGEMCVKEAEKQTKASAEAQRDVIEKAKMKDAEEDSHVIIRDT